ncbi:MAG: hypothetical protein DRN55_08060 [Thermoplasmata archaeon]|nr:MAG: hypothetical protein DRN55_08060 [Thermoplasmata archaeon]
MPSDNGEGLNSFNWMEYLTLAEYITGFGSREPSREALCRSAISRAYYSVLCYSRNYLLRAGELIPEELTSGSSHEVIIQRWIKGRDKMWRKVGVDLNRLRRYRKRADYEDEYNNIERELHLSLKYARRIFEILESLE